MSVLNTPQIPKVSFRYDTLDSTNAEALRQLNAQGPTATTVPAGAVFRTHAQTAGRGQGANAWHATPGDNLTLSVVLRPDHLTAARLFALVQYTGLSVAATVNAFLPPDAAATGRVKWPNDVYVGDRKIAGVLVQNGLRGSAVAWSVLGVGLNVNESTFPPELQPSAVSLKQLTGRTLDPDAVANRLYQELSTAYPLTAPSALPRLDAAYHQLLYRKDIPTLFTLTATGQPFVGIIRGVDAAGNLRVEQSIGREAAFAVGEVRVVR